tara:strand:- start:86 stop:889 length:804 start_codon:yes stop_codon:yes gene_type:complete
MSHYKSPAKLNLFLNIINKRNDGYHNIQSIFHLIDLFDYLSLNRRSDNRVVFSSNIKILGKDNLVTKSLDIVRKIYKVRNFGMDINLIKNIPLGSGLGGGSSNAATTLIALSEIWSLGISKKDLMALGLKLGSDVPFFINGKNAWVEGRGDKIKKISLDPKWYLLIFSKEPLLSRDIYKLIEIEEKKIKVTYDDFLKGKTNNIFENIVMKRYPTVARAKNWLSQFGKVKMSGTGGTIFASFNDFESAEKVFKLMPKSFDGTIVKGVE